ncbi:MAG: 4Fe-4S binding protein [Verrucomicrobia bacterium]|nr:4Fe-4S binding protein [Verrucomicrobiota bacterium]
MPPAAHATARARPDRTRVRRARVPAVLAGVCLVLMALNATAQHRFPPPDFEGGHTLPATTTPAPRALVLEYVDFGLLLAGLGVAAWLTLRRRSRRGVVILSLASLAYFGFYREGCLCVIGSIQNVALALADPGYVLPAFALGFFVAPLAVALFFGRAFCAGVCPHGALQDLVLVKPVKVPSWLEHALGILPFVYLGVGVLAAATGSGFIICRYDPFVPLFRLSGSFSLLVFGGAMLLLSLFVGRPYCRFLCPYGALLKMAASISRWRVRTTPDYCTQCRLCEESCPFGAMREPSSGAADPTTLVAERKRLTGLLVLTPVLIVALGWIGSRAGGPASLLHPTVALAESHLRQERAPMNYPPQSPEALMLVRARLDPAALLAQAAAVRRRFIVGGWLLGGWIGLVLGAKWISLSVRRHRTDFEPDRGACLSCARCFEFCPNERVRRGLLPPEALVLKAAHAGLPGAGAGARPAAAQAASRPVQPCPHA